MKRRRERIRAIPPAKSTKVGMIPPLTGISSPPFEVDEVVVGDGVAVGLMVSSSPIPT